eukprot:763880-Hanusia_phi.AAC.1
MKEEREGEKERTLALGLLKIFEVNARSPSALRLSLRHRLIGWGRRKNGLSLERSPPLLEHVELLQVDGKPLGRHEAKPPPRAFVQPDLWECEERRERGGEKEKKRGVGSSGVGAAG